MLNNLQLNTNDESLIEKFNSLTNRASVADMLEIDEERLNYYLYILPERDRYTSFEIPKKSGFGTRKISAPNESLKILQQKLNYILQLVYKPKKSVHGFISKATGEQKNIVTNAKVHSKKRYVFNLDLEDFFPNINFGRVRGMFIARPYNIPAEAATVLAQICCHTNQLPQGAPTSPIISNMICAKLDDELLYFAKQHSCLYTRYADDITFSTNDRVFPQNVAQIQKDGTAVATKTLEEIIKNNGFRINKSKVRLQKEYQRQVVTGLIVNRPPVIPNRSSTSPNVNRRYIAQLRAMLHAWERYGYENAAREYREKYAKKYRGEPPYSKNKHAEFYKVVRGKIDFLGQVRGKNNWMYIKFLEEFNALMYGKIEEAVWALESEAIDGELNCGTAFLLEGYGFITCHHVIDNNPVKIEIHQPSNIHHKITLEVVAKHKHLDLAILHANSNQLRFLSKSKLDPVQEAKIKLLGFPQYSKGHSITIKNGEIVRFQPFHGVKYVVISASIVEGNSGGPVLDEFNRVIGIASRGINQGNKDEIRDLDFNGVIPISYLDELKHFPSLDK